MVAAMLSPLARWVFGALAVVGILLGIYGWGYRNGDADRKSKDAAEQAAEILRQAGAAATAIGNSIARDMASNIQNQILSEKVDAYEQKLSAEAAIPVEPGACPRNLRLDAGDVGELRGLQR